MVTKAGAESDMVQHNNYNKTKQNQPRVVLGGVKQAPLIHTSISFSPFPTPKNAHLQQCLRTSQMGINQCYLPTPISLLPPLHIRYSRPEELQSFKQLHSQQQTNSTHTQDSHFPGFTNYTNQLHPHTRLTFPRIHQLC